MLVHRVGAIAFALMLAWLTAASCHVAGAQGLEGCPETANYISSVHITGYVRGAHSPWTADGTSVWSREPIAAAGYGIPMGAYVMVPDVGTFVIRDRGMLGYANVDILVDSVAEAYAITDTKPVCWWMPWQ